MPWLSEFALHHFLFHFGTLQLLLLVSPFPESRGMDHPNQTSCITSQALLLPSPVPLSCLSHACLSELRTFQKLYGVIEWLQMHLLFMTWLKMLWLIILSHQLSFFICQKFADDLFLLSILLSEHFLEPFCGCKNVSFHEKLLRFHHSFYSVHPMIGNHNDWLLDNASLLCLTHCLYKFLSDHSNLPQTILLKNMLRYSLCANTSVPS